MKGFLIFTIAAIGIIVFIGIVAMFLLPIGILKMHTIVTVERAYNYDNAQSYLLTLLSKTHGGDFVYNDISYSLQAKDPLVISYVKAELDKITDNKCYKLSSAINYTNNIAMKQGCTPVKYSAQAKIVLPYNPDRLTDTLTLVIE
ncbi:MAG TPA: hypothetical protein VJ343_01875 [archaeon]|nr:hypothetical protein [archaeon]